MVLYHSASDSGVLASGWSDPKAVTGTLLAMARTRRRCHHRLCAWEECLHDHATYLGEQFTLTRCGRRPQRPGPRQGAGTDHPAKAQELTIHLRTALSTRPIIDQAIGLLRGRTGETADEALSRLRELSQAEHIKVIVVGPGSSTRPFTEPAGGGRVLTR